MSGTYPIFEDKEFNLKIHAKKEFRDYQNTQDIDTDFDKKFDEICNADFELTNHQFFVKHYLSPNTPYNSLLLYHGLGTGKTCSAISICEEIRKIYKRIAYNKRIMIIASPNVQNNFKNQLFDSSKLKKENNIWKLNNTCIGNIILEELFPKQKNDLSKEVVIAAVKRFINTHYLFMGYIEFANYIKKLNDRKRPLQEEFDNRLIVIDEVHNMKTTCDKAKTRCAYYLKLLVDNVKFMKLVFLTATPMFNSYKEIFEILNLMRSNDNLLKIDESEIVDKEGNFITDTNTGEETGLQKFIDYSRGYVSYVRGENPYSFPFRIMPSLHSPQESLINQSSYPNYSPDKKLISENEKIKYIDLYMNTLQESSFQYVAYGLMKDKNRDYDIGTPYIMNPLNQILNFAYPDSIPDKEYKRHNSLYGKEGILRLMNYKETKIQNPNKESDITRNVQYSYKSSTTTDYGNIFNPNIIGEYSHKLKNISNHILDSEGIVLIYSQYIEGGLIPTALMLEEMGFTRHDGENLLKTTKTNKKLFYSYVIISGDKRFSPDNNTVVSKCSQIDNKDGSLIKVILISKAASEGLDFKFIRQVHILDPWFNLNRNEQIVGRAIRMCSHRDIVFEKRNVCIFFHATNLNLNEEASDMYMYRLCEQKAIQIAKLSRLLKQNAVDCMLNTKQTHLTEENFDKSVTIMLSNKKKVSFNVGDKPYTLFCDFDRTCSYECINNRNITSTLAPSNLDESTYNFNLLETNSDIVVQKITNFFANYDGITTYNNLQTIFNNYSFSLIEFAIDKLVKNKTPIHDRMNREGTLVVFGDFILFKPTNLYPKASVYDRLHPSHNTHSKITFKYNDNFKLEKNDDEILFTKINKGLDNFFSNSETPQETKDDDTNWYIIANSFIDKLNMLPEDFATAIYGHLLDDLDFEDKIKVLNNVFDSKKNVLIKDQYIQGIKRYIDLRTFFIDEDTKAIVIKKDKRHLFVKHNNIWKPATLQENKLYRKILLKELEEKMNRLEKQQNTIGFTHEYNKTYIFKLKNMAEPKNTGHRCNQTKRKTIQDLSETLLSKLKLKVPTNSSKELRDILFSKSGPKTLTFDPNSTFSSCVLVELLLRYSHLEKVENSFWFLDVFEPLTVSEFTKFIKNKQ